MREFAAFTRFLKTICREAEIVLPWRRNGKGCSKTNVCRLISKFPERNFFVANWAIHFTEWTSFLVKITSCRRKFGSAAMYSKFALLQKLLTHLARNITVTEPKMFYAIKNTLAESGARGDSRSTLLRCLLPAWSWRPKILQHSDQMIKYSKWLHW